MKRIAYALVATAAAATLACNGTNSANDRRMSGTEMSDGGSTTVNDRSGTAMNDRPGESRATLTGCLLAGGDAGSYVLQLASADMPGGGNGASSAPAPTAHPAADTYRIVGSANTGDLEKNLNKRVAIDGYVDRDTNAAIGTSGTQGRAATDSTSIPASQLPTIRPESVRSVAGQCQPAPQSPERR